MIKKEIPYGYCHCGCGEKTTIASTLYSRKRYTPGEPVKFISGHHCKGKNHYLWAGGRHLSDSGYVLVLVKGHPRCDSQGYVREHILIVEEAYGIEVTLEMEIHHKNKKRSDNRLENLVVCPDAAYHQALHVKEMALKTCGNPSYRKCRICGIWDNPDNMYVKGDKVRHNKCHSEYEKKRRAKKNKERRPLT